MHLTEENKDLDERTALLLKQADPIGILTSAPGVTAITAAAILGRLGDPNRFDSLAGARAFTGLVPILDSSGLNGRHGGPTKRGDAVLREALFMAAGQARRIDPTLAAKYHRLDRHDAVSTEDKGDPGQYLRRPEPRRDPTTDPGSDRPAPSNDHQQKQEQSRNPSSRAHPPMSQRSQLRGQLAMSRRGSAITRQGGQAALFWRRCPMVHEGLPLR